MGKYAQLVHIADQLGDLKSKKTLTLPVKIALENWLTAGGVSNIIMIRLESFDWIPSKSWLELRLNDQHYHGYTILLLLHSKI